jgi:hypothetical protein
MVCRLSSRNPGETIFSGQYSHYVNFLIREGTCGKIAVALTGHEPAHFVEPLF